ncbi:hypothetical protein N7444_003735 [Penicillium canescens]|nr:hypothetical protein N7444_003735 [Penicillium canescens]
MEGHYGWPEVRAMRSPTSWAAQMLRLAQDAEIGDPAAANSGAASSATNLRENSVTSKIKFHESTNLGISAENRDQKGYEDDGYDRERGDDQYDHYFGHDPGHDPGDRDPEDSDVTVGFFADQFDDHDQPPFRRAAFTEHTAPVEGTASKKHAVVTCRNYRDHFDTKTSLYRHLKGCTLYAQHVHTGEATVAIGAISNTRRVCLDSGCVITLIDSDLVKELRAQATPTKPILVHGIGSKHVSSSYVVIDTFYFGKDNTAQITIEAYVVDKLRAGLLIGMDVIGHEGFRIDTDNRTIRIASCIGITIPIDIQVKSPRKLASRLRYLQRS